jgi:predicted enzyme related to lactoylglutathione lyase
MAKLGTFIWHDLMTTDLATSKHFYTKLFDWKAVTHEGGMPYTEISTAAGRPQGGMMAEDPSKGIPSHWMGYVLVENVDKTTARAVELGGKTLMAPMDIPQVGRFAVLQDPQGATFAPFTYAPGHAEKAEEDGPPTHGRFCWDELSTSDPQKAAKFYGALFGWDVQGMDMGGGMTYWMATKDGAQVAGIMKTPKDAPHPPMWLAYVAADVDAKAKLSQELGARVYVPPTDIPNVGRFAVLGDPTGATIALFRSNKW